MYYEQLDGAAMGSPISPLIANLFMEELKVKALSTFPHPPRLWLRFVDDTFVIIKTEHSQQLLEHINSQDPHIQFTVEEPSQQGTLSFLDTLVTIGPNHNFHTTVYRKPTHTDQYLHWDSNHFITAKQSVYNTLAHRAKTVSSKQEALHMELHHIKRHFGLANSPHGLSINFNIYSLGNITTSRAPIPIETLLIQTATAGAITTRTSPL